MYKCININLKCVEKIILYRLEKNWEVRRQKGTRDNLMFDNNNNNNNTKKNKWQKISSLWGSKMGHQIYNFFTISFNLIWFYCLLCF